MSPTAGIAQWKCRVPAYLQTVKRYESTQIPVLVTGAGGPAAIGVMRSLAADPTYILIAADMDPWASGLYLVDSINRVILPEATSENFIDTLLHVGILLIVLKR